MRSEKKRIAINGNRSQWIKTGLFELSNSMIYRCSTLALFGEIDPISLENDFQLLDDSFQYFGARLPRWIYLFFFSKQLKARDRLINALSNTNPSSRESKFIRARKLMLEQNSDLLSKKDIGAYQTGMFWGSLGNSEPALFWCSFYILQDEKAVEIIRKEIDTHLPWFSLENDCDDSIIQQWTPEQLNLCVYLESAVNEVLRLVAAPTSVKLAPYSSIFCPDSLY